MSVRFATSNPLQKHATAAEMELQHSSHHKGDALADQERSSVVSPLEKDANSFFPHSPPAKQVEDTAPTKAEILTIPPIFTFKTLSIICFLMFFQSWQNIIAPAVGYLIFVERYNMNAIWLLVGSALYNILQAYAQIAVGRLSDQVKSKFGRRKPFFVITWILTTIVNFGLVFPPKDASSSTIAGWYVFFYPINAIANTCFTIPFGAMLVESAASPDDYQKFLSIVNVFNLLGALIAGVLTQLIMPTLPLLLPFAGAVGFGLSIFLVFYWFPTTVNKKVEKQPALIPSFRLCWKTSEFRILWLNETLFGTANGILNTIVAVLIITGGYFSNNTSYGMFTVVQFSSCGIMAVVSGCVFTFFILPRFDKVTVYRWLLIASMIVSLGGFFVSFIKDQYGPILLFLIIFYAITGPIFFIEGFFLKDLVTYDTFLTGKNRESMYITALSLPSQIVGNFFGYIPSVIIYTTGYKALDGKGSDLLKDNYSWTETTVWEARCYMTFLFIFITMMSYLVFWNYPMTSKVANQISNAVKKRVAKKIQAENEAEAAGQDINSLDYRSADVGIDDVEESYGSIAQNESDMLLNHFTGPEISLIAHSNPNQPENAGLLDIKWRCFIGITFGGAASILLIAGMGIQMKKFEATFIMLIVQMLLVTSMYVLYEAMRLGAIRELSKHSNNTLTISAFAIDKKNKAHSESLQDLLARNGIDDGEDDNNSSANANANAGTANAGAGVNAGGGNDGKSSTSGPYPLERSNSKRRHSLAVRKSIAPSAVSSFFDSNPAAPSYFMYVVLSGSSLLGLAAIFVM